MTKMKLYTQTAFKISKIVTTSYSTSFSYATNLLNKEHRKAIYSIYGFVRFADEIVDTFHKHNKSLLLNRFEKDLKEAIDLKISLNPVLHAFQKTIHKYKIPYEYIDAFLTSMRYDLSKKIYTCDTETEQYIYGSADVVGLMCLQVFCDASDDLFVRLKTPAMKLGSAFQKVNFIRDLKDDCLKLGRNYFPNINLENFSENTKKQLVEDVKLDFNEALEGIKLLPQDSRLAVYLAYLYYKNLLRKIEKTNAKKITSKRTRISDFKKLTLMVKAKTIVKLNLL